MACFSDGTSGVTGRNGEGSITPSVGTRIPRAQYVSLPRFLSGFSGLRGSLKRLNHLESTPANGSSPPFRTIRLAYSSPSASRRARSWRAIPLVECPERAKRVEGPRSWQAESPPWAESTTLFSSRSDDGIVVGDDVGLHPSLLR